MTVARDELIATAKTYLDGILAADGSGARLADDCWRVEQGRNTGTNAEEVRAALETMSYVKAMRNIRWFVADDGENVFAWYLLDVEGGVTSFIAERFRVLDGLIHEIEVVFAFAIGAELQQWPDDPSMVWPRNPDGSYAIG
jgi:hypothetical protein